VAGIASRRPGPRTGGASNSGGCEVGGTAEKCVVVFVDYQNTYRSARDAFHDHSFDPHWLGQIHPMAFGLLLVRLSGDPERALTQVRMYGGLPSNQHDPRGYAAARRQIAAWEKLPQTHVTTRSLRYPRDYPREKPEEKGIEVRIALDFYAMAVRNEYDVGILMSGDTDLLPALEEVEAMAEGPSTEVAAWSPLQRRLHVKGSRTLCIRVDEDHCRTIQDNRDCNH